jgi:hypothetical protein
MMMDDRMVDHYRNGMSVEFGLRHEIRLGVINCTP